LPEKDPVGKKDKKNSMAVITDAQRQKCARRTIREIYEFAFQTANLTYADIKAAADASDDWADTNASAYNTALPVPFRTTATLQQKTVLLAVVILERAGLLDKF
jgi:hypothetical protein